MSDLTPRQKNLARNKAMRVFYDRPDQTATLDEILRADFGEFPPKGVETLLPLKNKVTFRSFWQDAYYLRQLNNAQKRINDNLPNHPRLAKMRFAFEKAYHAIGLVWSHLTTAGYVYTTDSSTIHYVGDAFKNDGVSLVGHEAVHILQHARNNLDYWERPYNSNTSALPAAEDHSRFWKNTKKRKFHFTAIYTAHKGSEVQARLHQAMASGYVHWGYLPENKIELWAALRSNGVIPPSAIRTKLEETEEGKAAQEKFRLIRSFRKAGKELVSSIATMSLAASAPCFITACVSFGGEINLLRTAFYSFALTFPYAVTFFSIPLLRSLSRAKFTGTDDGRVLNNIQLSFKDEAVRTAYWERHLPALYGDLLELYGDRNGRQKMGLPTNPRFMSHWKKTLRQESGVYDLDDMRRWVSELNTEEKMEQLAEIISTNRPRAKANDGKMIRALLEAPDVRANLSTWRDEYRLGLAALSRRPSYIIRLVDAGMDLNTSLGFDASYLGETSIYAKACRHAAWLESRKGKGAKAAPTP